VAYYRLVTDGRTHGHRATLRTALAQRRAVKTGYLLYLINVYQKFGYKVDTRKSESRVI